MGDEMTEPLRILLLEDSPTDAELNERALRRAGIAFTAQRVDSLPALASALDTFRPELILADYHLPGFDGLQALELVLAKSPEIPYIFVSGAMGEELAVDSIKRGATDYVIKDRLARLPVAVRRAIEEKTLKTQRAEAEDRFRVIFENARDGIVLIGESGLIADCNPEFERQAGRPLEQLRQTHIWELRPADKIEAARNKFYEIWRTGSGGTSELAFQRPDGAIVPIEFRGVAVHIGGRRYLQSISRDITERKRVEQALAASEERYHQLFENMGSGVAIYQPNAACETFVFSSINRAAERIDQMRRDQVVGRNLEELFPGAREQGFLEAFRRVCRSGVAEHFSTAFYKDERISGWRENYVYRLESGELVAVYDDVSERVERETQIQRLNRTLRTISACNQDLVHAKCEEELLNAVCRDIIEIGGHLLAWVSYCGENPEEPCRTAAHHGDEAVFQIHADMEHDDDHARHCLTLAALHTRKTASCNRLMESEQCAFGRLFDAGVNAILALPLISNDRLYGALTVFSALPDAFDAAEARLMEELADDLAYGIDALRTMAERDSYIDQFSQAMKNTVTAIARTLEMRDPYTAGHQQRVTALSVLIAREMGLTEDMIEGLYFGAMIHDIGKISVPAEILSKPSTLSKLEFMLIQHHPKAGFEIVQGIEFPWPVAEMIAQHHERLDGSGYPYRLQGDEIIFEARIIAVADVVEAMTTHRPYRAALGIEAALAEIEQGKDGRYDAAVVDACVRVIQANGMQLPQL